MILAINVNAALDRVFFIERFVANTHMRTHKEVLSVGGKGLDTALVLQTLGAPVRALTFIAGKNGQILRELLRQRGVETETIEVPGETRVANVIVETGLNRHSHITTSGYSLTPGDCAAFLAKIDQLAGEADWAVMAGSLPQGAGRDFYCQIIQQAHQRGCQALIDCFGEPLLESLAAGPEIVKMNQDEFQETFQAQAREPGEWIAAGKAAIERTKIQTLVITRGKDGILAFTPGGIYQAGAPEIQEVNGAGAGDAVSAALVYRLACGDSWPQALHWAAAASAAVVMTEGTAECRMEDILSLYPRTWVREV